MKPCVSAGLLLVLEGSALAQPPVQAPAPPVPWTARDARLIVSAERMFGLHAYRARYEPAQGDTREISGVMASVLRGQSVINSEDDAVNPYALPRIAVDAAFARAFTLGGNIGFGATAGEEGTGEDLPTVSGFAVHARFGYLIVSSATLAVWLRAGPEYSWGSYDDAGARVENVTKALALTIDPQLAIMPVSHAAILVGPLINVGVWGSYERRFPSSSEEVDFTISNFGVTGAIALLF
jgi:hypothetical protein